MPLEIMNEGDIVEITSVPFNEERAEIVSIATTNVEIVVKLLDLRFTLPIVIQPEKVRKVE